MSIKSNVVILSKTKMSNPHVCVGAYDIEHNRMLRLLGSKTERLLDTCPYEIGQLYDMTYGPKYKIEFPHTEDVAVYESNLLSEHFDYFDDLTEHLAKKDINLDDLFNGLLKWENSKGYLAEEDKMIDHSVAIATLNYSLVRMGDCYSTNDIFNRKMVKYVGYRDIQQLPRVINAGTKIRFSLPRMWDMNNDGNKRSYLQLSGIY